MGEGGGINPDSYLRLYTTNVNSMWIRISRVKDKTKFLDKNLRRFLMALRWEEIV